MDPGQCQYLEASSCQCWYLSRVIHIQWKRSYAIIWSLVSHHLMHTCTFSFQWWNNFHLYRIFNPKALCKWSQRNAAQSMSVIAENKRPRCATYPHPNCLLCQEQGCQACLPSNPCLLCPGAALGLWVLGPQQPRWWHGRWPAVRQPGLIGIHKSICSLL